MQETIEYSKKYVDDLDDEKEESEGTEAEELIKKTAVGLEPVSDNAENGILLNEIFDLARANYEKDTQGWEDLFENLRLELMSTDDEENHRDILENYLRKADKEMI
jgi:hypothetical protein